MLVSVQSVLATMIHAYYKGKEHRSANPEGIYYNREI